MHVASLPVNILADQGVVLGQVADRCWTHQACIVNVFIKNVSLIYLLRRVKLIVKICCGLLICYC